VKNIFSVLITASIIPEAVVPIFAHNTFTFFIEVAIVILLCKVTTFQFVVARFITIDPIKERNFVHQTVVIIATIELLAICSTPVTVREVFIYNPLTFTPLITIAVITRQIATFWPSCGSINDAIEPFEEWDFIFDATIVITPIVFLTSIVIEITPGPVIVNNTFAS
jgi:hypothetical protein